MRRAGADDLETLLAIQKDSSLAGFAHIYPPTRYPYPDEGVREQTLQTLADGAVALIDDAEEGFALVTEGWLQKLYVRPVAWGSGVAGELHDAALAELRMLGGSEAQLWTLEHNERARRFYEKRGWQLNGRTRVVPFPPNPIDVGYSIELA
ncbi:MAG: GNAT family N-acetyltransferase [Gaiellaceae bacterium]